MSSKANPDKDTRSDEQVIETRLISSAAEEAAAAVRVLARTTELQRCSTQTVRDWKFSWFNEESPSVGSKLAKEKKQTVTLQQISTKISQQQKLIDT